MKSKVTIAVLALAASVLVMPTNSAQAGFHREMDCLFGWMHRDHFAWMHRDRDAKVYRKKTHKKHMMKKSKKAAKKA